MRLKLRQWKRRLAIFHALCVALCIAVCMTVLFTGCGAASDGEAPDIEMSGTETSRVKAANEEDIKDGTAETETPETKVTSVEAIGAETTSEEATAAGFGEQQNAFIDEEGSYTTKEDVALYLETYEKLPGNFITKSEARKLGWEGGSLEPYAPGKCIGGDKFGNYEGLLPAEKGRTYRECDIDTLGADSRGAKRIVYSDDGLIYYTEDHYASFTLLYD